MRCEVSQWLFGRQVMFSVGHWPICMGEVIGKLFQVQMYLRSRFWKYVDAWWAVVCSKWRGWKCASLDVVVELRGWTWNCKCTFLVKSIMRRVSCALVFHASRIMPIHAIYTPLQRHAFHISFWCGIFNCITCMSDRACEECITIPPKCRSIQRPETNYDLYQYNRLYVWEIRDGEIPLIISDRALVIPFINTALVNAYIPNSFISG
jgi:hypothetical protein